MNYARFLCFSTAAGLWVLASHASHGQILCDVNRDDRVNAVDIQLVINGALGIDVAPLSADVNLDGWVNAIDVQLVIMAVLGMDVSPSAAFSAEPRDGPAPLTVQFRDESEPGSAAICARDWDFGDGEAGADQDPVHTYASPGVYDVSLRVVTAHGESIESKSGYITVGATPGNDYEQELALLDAAYEHYETVRTTQGVSAALEATAGWARSSGLVSDAGVSTTGTALWIHFEMDLTAGIMVNLFAGSLPDKTSVSPLPRTLYEGPTSSFTPKITGMMLPPAIFAPFRTALAPGDETVELAEHYTVPVINLPPTVHIEEMALVDEIKWVLGWDGGFGNAQHFIMKTHGDRIRLKGSNEETTVLCTGEWVTDREQCLPHDEGFRAGRLALVRPEGHDYNYIAFTPAFVRHWGGVPSPADRDWLVRYVYMAACHGACEDMRVAFLDSGAVCYAGFDGPVRNGFTQQVAGQFFAHLLGSETVHQAYQAVEPNIDSETNAMFIFESAAPSPRWFYRASLVAGETVMLTAAYDWLTLVENEMASYCVDAITGDFTGTLYLTIDPPSVGTFPINLDSDTEIRFVTPEGRNYEASASVLEDDGPCEGMVHVTSMGPSTGGLAAGRFEAILAHWSIMAESWETLEIEGGFTAIRRRVP